MFVPSHREPFFHHFFSTETMETGGRTQQRRESGMNKISLPFIRPNEKCIEWIHTVLKNVFRSTKCIAYYHSQRIVLGKFNSWKRTRFGFIESVRRR